MYGQLAPRAHRNRIVTAASTFALIVSSLVLVGWAFDVETLKRIFPKLVAMNPVTALAFILLGLSLWLSRTESASRKTRLAAKLCAGLVAMVGLLKLTEVLSG